MSSIPKRPWCGLVLAWVVAWVVGGVGAQPPEVGAGREVLATLPLDGAVDAAADGRVFVEVTTPDRAPFRGEAVEVALRIGFERSFFETQLLAMFRQEMELPVQVQASWSDDLACVAWSDWLAGGDVRLARNAVVGRARRLPVEMRDDQAFVVHELRWQMVAACAGELVLPEPVLRFAYASAFRQDIFQGRMPIDRVDAYRRGPGTTLVVRDLPEPVPAEFCGAVGAYRVEAELDRSQAVAGEGFGLRILVRGQGVPELLTAPALPDWDGVHVLGVVERTMRGGREFRFELSGERPGVLALPLTVATFDPASPDGYRFEAIEDLRILIAAGGRAISPKASPVAGVDDVHPLKTDRGSRPGGVVPGWSLLLPWVAALGVRTWWRGRRRRVDPVRDRARHALARFEAEGGGESAFANFLGGCLGADSAAIGPDAARRLEQLGLPGELAERAIAEVERSTASRYGGSREAGRVDLAALAREVAAALGVG